MLRHFLRDDDLTPAEQLEVLELADALKKDPYSSHMLAGPQSAAILFDKTSTRTRFSFDTGVAQLGGNPIVVEAGVTQIGKGETIADTARVFSRFVSLIVWRTYGQDRVEDMAASASVPVINALTDDWHPCQILADLQTIRENFGKTEGLTLTYVGDGANNMANSLLVGGLTAGMNVRIGAPEGFTPGEDILAAARQRAELTGTEFLITNDPVEAVAGTNVVYTDTWVSMGQESEKAERSEIFRPYSVTTGAMALAAEHAVFLHCLPAYRGLEVAAEVIDGSASLVWEEAENRLHVQKALLTFLLDSSGLSADLPAALRREETR